MSSSDKHVEPRYENFVAAKKGGMGALSFSCVPVRRNECFLEARSVG